MAVGGVIFTPMTQKLCKLRDVSSDVRSMATAHRSSSWLVPPLTANWFLLTYVTVTSSLAGLASIASSQTPTVLGCPDGCLCSNSTGHVTCDEAKLESFPVFDQLSITALDLSRNSIRRLDASTFVGSRLGNVVELKLRQNGIGHIDAETFAGRPIANRLQILDLSENVLGELRPGALRPLKHLVHLDLAANHLSSIDGAFDGLAELVRLDLRANRLTAVGRSTFTGLQSLRYLRLDDNSISLIDERAFAPLERLAYLAMKANPLGGSSGIRFKFRSSFLTYVDMSECQLDHVPRGLPPSVRYLQLRRNRLRRLDVESLADCSSDLNILVLDENELEDIEDGALASATGLQQVWFNGNRLRTIPRPLPTGLQKLFMDSNQLESLTGEDLVTAPTKTTSVGRLSNPENENDENSHLIVVSLMSNNITTLSSDAFRKLRRLQSLDLSGNRITRLPSGTFTESNARLRTLSISNNPIATIESMAFGDLTDLETLALSYVTAPNISVAHDAFSSDLPSLRRVDLDSSPTLFRRLLVHPPNDLLVSRFRTVRDLVALGSELETLPVDFFGTRFVDLTVLRLSSARWRCDQRLVWLRNWLLSETTVHVDQPDENFRCAVPPEVADRPLTSLDESEFAASSSKSVDVYRPQLPRRSTMTSSWSSTQSTDQTTDRPRQHASDESTTRPTISSSRGSGESAPTWEEILRRALDDRTRTYDVDIRSAGVHGRSLSGGGNVTSLSPPASITVFFVADPETVSRAVGSVDDLAQGRGRGLTIALVTVFVTILLVAILLTVIAYLCRKQRHIASLSLSSTAGKSLYVVASSPSNYHHGGSAVTYVGVDGSCGNGMNYGSTSMINGRTRHHVQWRDQTPATATEDGDDTVYFTLANGTSGQPSVTVKPSRCGCNGPSTAPRSAAVVERRHSPAAAAFTSVVDGETVITANNGRELIPLVPGREVQYKGPLRVYKWEDF